ncbi:MAG: UbiA family prenyltransferase [Candidatus Moraniibacteriota bacterium]
MLKFLNNLIEKLETAQTSFYLWAITFLSIIFARVLMENWLGGMVNKSGDYFFHHVAYTFFFFFMSYSIFVGLLMINLKLELKKAANISLFGYLIIIFPPLIDYIVLRDSFFLSFYGIYELADMPYRFFTVFGKDPHFGVTYGVRVEIVMTVLALILYGYLKTGKTLKSLWLGIQAYLILFVLASFPSWITIFLLGWSKGFFAVVETDIVKLFLTSAKFFSRETGTYLNALSIKLTTIYSLMLMVVINLGLYFNYRNKFIAFVKNCRPVQIIYHLGLLVVGMGLGMFFTQTNWDFNLFNGLAFLNIALAVIFAWLASVVVNDIYDKQIDGLTNKKRPLLVGIFTEKEYIVAGVVIWLASLLYAGIINPKIVWILIAYQALAWFYSAWPLRLKRFPIVASLISALASCLIMFAGFMLVSPGEDIQEFPRRIFWLVLIALTISLPIKDLKDIAGDKLDKVYTIPVIFGEYWGKVIIGSGIFLSYFLSIIFLNEFSLNFWAILLGGLSFWVVIFSGNHKKINNRNVIWWVLALLLVYLLILLKLIFLEKLA